MADINIDLDKDSLGVGQTAGAVKSFGNKVIDTISSAIGIIYEPTRIKRFADAKAYEQRTLADAKAYEIEALTLAQSDANAQNDSALALTIERTSKRFVAQEIKRQLNLDNIVSKAIEQIQCKKEVSKDAVDLDWTTRFINLAQDISDNEMQDIWARILAGETAQPRTYSLRTLECLKNLTKDEAALFVKFASLALMSNNDPFVYRDNDLLSKYGITYPDIQRLVEIGLLNTGEYTVKEFSTQSFCLVYNQKIAMIFIKGKYSLPLYSFSSSGIQMFSLVSKEFNEQYFIDVLTGIRKMKKVESIKYYNIISVSDKTISYDNKNVVEL